MTITNKSKKMKIATTTVTQSANELLGTKEKRLYYLVIENKQGKKLTINVGEKTHNQVKELKEEEEGVTKIQFDNGKVK
jgi:antitoxin component YwqK of YwqJK toxin-antitoxin module